MIRILLFPINYVRKSVKKLIYNIKIGTVNNFIGMLFDDPVLKVKEFKRLDKRARKEAHQYLTNYHH